jgi:hypothetical protein
MADEKENPTGGVTPPASETEKKEEPKTEEPVVNPTGENKEDQEDPISAEELEQLKKDPTVLYRKLRKEVRQTEKEKKAAEEAAAAARLEADKAKGNWEQIAETRLQELTKAQTEKALAEQKAAAVEAERQKLQAAKDAQDHETVNLLTANWPEKAKAAVGTAETKSAMERLNAYKLLKDVVVPEGSATPKPPASAPDPADARQGGGNTPDEKQKIDATRRSLIQSGIYG